MKRNWRRVCSLLALLGAVGLVSATTRSGRPPAYDNLLLVTLDTQRADRLGLYGYPRPTSPFLDRLGREGIVFHQAIASSSHTAPSHASILTSLHPEQHRVLVNGVELPPQVTSLAELAQDSGLETAAFVSVRFLEGLRAGFDTFDAAVPRREVFRRGDRTVDAAVAWLRGRDRSRRFALWVHLYDAHQHGTDAELPEPHFPRMREDSTRRGAELLRFLREQQGYPKEELDGNLDRYDAQVAFTDTQVRRLFAALDGAAPRERTLAIVTADHGEGLGNHGVEGHGRHLFQEQVRVPLVVRVDPARTPPSEVRSLVRHVDLLPTAAELLGLRFSASELRPEGRSLVRLLSDPGADTGIDAAFSQRRPPDERRREVGWEEGVKLAAQDASFKYVWSSEGPHEFYDLRRDPYELHNLVGEPIPQKDSLRAWLLGKYRALLRDRRGGDGGSTIDPRHLEDLKALGYI